MPVLATETQTLLAREGGAFVDGTLGDGGHARLLLEASGVGARLLGIDLDQEALSRAADNMPEFAGRITFWHGSFARIGAAIAETGFPKPNGILFDLGMSTLHLGAERGFSFKNTGSLDMRYDASGEADMPEPEMFALKRLSEEKGAFTAADVVNSLKPKELARIFRDNADERFADRIAEEIVEARKAFPIGSAAELAAIVVGAYPPAARHGKTHAATKVFQALRMAVNRERETLALGIAGALNALAEGGRFGIISFHSGEDRTIKKMFKEAGPAFRILTKHAIQAKWEEKKENPWSRSARLRAIEKINIKNEKNQRQK